MSAKLAENVVRHEFEEIVESLHEVIIENAKEAKDLKVSVFYFFYWKLKEVV